MTQTDRRIILIKELIKEHPEYLDIVIPQNEPEQKKLLRSLFNIRRPKPVSNKFLELQNAYLQAEVRQKGITSLSYLITYKERNLSLAGRHYNIKDRRNSKRR